MAKAIALLLLAAGVSACTGSQGDAQSIRRSASTGTGTWDVVNQAFMGGPPGTLALLTDGRVLVNGGPYLASWYTLTPDASGSYQNGTWAQVGSTTLGRWDHPNFVLRDGRFWNGGGEAIFSADPTRQVRLTQAGSEIFDPVTNAWVGAPDMPHPISGTAAAVLADGRLLVLSQQCFNNIGPLCYSDVLSSYGVAPSWSSAAPWSLANGNGDSERSSLLLPDASVLTGTNGFQRYLPGSDAWVQTAAVADASGPIQLSNNDEIGPSLLLYDGRVLELGANGNNAFYTPPLATDPTGPGSWARAAVTPLGYNSGDTCAAVEPNGLVLAVADPSVTGQGNQPGNVYEYDATANAWSAPLTVPFSTDHIGTTFFLLLPNGQIFTAPNGSDHAYVYTPAGSPQPAWRPTITSVAPAPVGELLSGVQLNGLTTGADFGDDFKMATNYPIAWLTDGAGHVTYCRTFNFDQMAPRASTPGSALFTVPNSVADGSYTLHVSANGIQASNTLPITLSGPRALTPLTGATKQLPGYRATMRVTLAAPAPAGGALVNLLSSEPGTITVPATVTVPEGATWANFTSDPVHAYGRSTITAATAADPAFVGTADFGWAVKDLTGPALPTVSVGAATWTISLSTNAPSFGPVYVNMQSDNPGGATVPPNVPVSVGTTSATFSVFSGCPANGLATVTASLVGSVVTKQFGHTVQSVSGPPTATGGSGSATWTVTLNGTAPYCGVQVSLQSSNPAVATVPATLIVPQGATSATFDVTVVDPTAGSTTITASLVGSSQTGSFGYSVVSQTASSSSLSVASNNSAVATLTLNGNAPAGGLLVTLQNLFPAKMTAPPSVTVPAGSSTATYNVTALAIGIGRVKAKIGSTSSINDLIVSIGP
jgi:hypothetical protein